jgi:hypothetical protein
VILDDNFAAISQVCLEITNKLITDKTVW